MGAVIGELLPLAVGVAVSSIPILAVILMLLSADAHATAVGFAAGWVIGIVAATVLFVVLSEAVTPEDGSSATSWIKLVLGAVLLAVGVQQLRGRNDQESLPTWMAAIDTMTVPTGFGLGCALAAVNPKNIVMYAAAGVTISSAELATGTVVLSAAVFAVLASTTVVVPVVAYLLAADRLRKPLATLKDWLQVHNAAVIGTLVFVIGFVLMGKGIGGLT